MVRMQVQLPEELYRQLRRIAESREWSFAETLRRASELLICAYPQVRHSPKKEWELPLVDVGEPLVPFEKWAEILEQDLVERHIR